MKVLAMPNASTFIAHRKYVHFFPIFLVKIAQSEHKTYDALGRRITQANRQGLIIIKGGKYFSRK